MTRINTLLRKVKAELTAEKPMVVFIEDNKETNYKFRLSFDDSVEYFDSRADCDNKIEELQKINTLPKKNLYVIHITGDLE